MIFVTGSSGYVASNLVPLLKHNHDVVGIDYKPSKNTDIVIDIGSNDLNKELKPYTGNEITIINLAAARFDFGANASRYYYENVESQKYFLKNISQYKIKNFIHISSVAAIDGSLISFKDNLSCDDAYRSTKFLQEELIKDWCKKNNINLFILSPSAIFSNSERVDTNIGKMQKFIKYLPFIPNIKIKKSLTYLPNLSNFIIKCLQDDFKAGHYLTIERSVLSVSQMIMLLSKKNLRVIELPLLQANLNFIAHLLNIIGGFGLIDTKLTPGRVKKLFTDTSYDFLYEERCIDFDLETYSQSNDDLRSILRSLN